MPTLCCLCSISCKELVTGVWATEGKCLLQKLKANSTECACQKACTYCLVCGVLYVEWYSIGLCMFYLFSVNILGCLQYTINLLASYNLFLCTTTRACTCMHACCSLWSVSVELYVCWVVVLACVCFIYLFLMLLL